MVLSLKKSIFLLLFSCFQVLIFFSFYTSYQLIVISLFLIFLLFYFWFFKLEILVNPRIGLLWFGLVIFLILSSVFTHSVPFSLDKIIFYTSSFSIFVFFRSLVASKLFLKSELVVTFLLVGLVLSTFFIAFFSFPEISSFLPSVNIFTTKHGHSHFTALLLLLIPLGWWFATSNEYKIFTYRQSILVLFYVLLIFTFGRFAIFLSLLQLPFIYKLVNKKPIKNTYLYLVGFILISALVSSMLFSKNSTINCSIHEFRSQLCKPISSEARPEYFEQAMRSFKAHPLFGYGPGTFSLITKKFNIIIQRSSIYTHNNFLQIFAESGIFVGAIYIFLIGFLFKNMTYVLRKNKTNFVLNHFIFLGLVSLLINSFIDFDWDIFPIFQMTVIFISFILWDYPVSSLKNNEFGSVVRNFFIKYFWLFLTITLVTLGIINFITKVLISTDNSSLAFKIFPYFYSQSKYFLTGSSLPKYQMKSLYQIYENHAEFILQDIEEEHDVKKKIILYERLIEVKKWEATNKNYYQLLLDLSYYRNLGEASYRGLFLLLELEDNGIGQTYESKREIIDYLLESVYWHKGNGEYELYDKYHDCIWSIWDEGQLKCKN